MTPVRLEPAAPQSRVKHSTTEQLRSYGAFCGKLAKSMLNNLKQLSLLITVINEEHF